MKLTTMTQVTVDGVMQGNGGVSDEDRRSGFERGGWARGKGDDETRTFINQTYERADAFLFGRRTYEIFARGWGVMDRGSHPIADALNTKPKYLASTTIADPQWANTTILSGDFYFEGDPNAVFVNGDGTIARIVRGDTLNPVNLAADERALLSHSG